MKGPDPKSKRTARRRNRNFQGVSSTRKHKRSQKRQDLGRFFDNKDHQPGEKGLCASGPNPRKQWMYTASGANKFH
jgi:hypothetical protein